MAKAFSSSPPPLKDKYINDIKIISSPPPPQLNKYKSLSDALSPENRSRRRSLLRLHSVQSMKASKSNNNNNTMDDYDNKIIEEPNNMDTDNDSDDDSTLSDMESNDIINPSNNNNIDATPLMTVISDEVSQDKILNDKNLTKEFKNIAKKYSLDLMKRKNSLENALSVSKLNNIKLNEELNNKDIQIQNLKNELNKKIIDSDSKFREIEVLKQKNIDFGIEIQKLQLNIKYERENVGSLNQTIEEYKTQNISLLNEVNNLKMTSNQLVQVFLYIY